MGVLAVECCRSWLGLGLIFCGCVWGLFGVLCELCFQVDWGIVLDAGLLDLFC